MTCSSLVNSDSVHSKPSNDVYVYLLSLGIAERFHIESHRIPKHPREINKRFTSLDCYGLLGSLMLTSTRIIIAIENEFEFCTLKQQFYSLNTLCWISSYFLFSNCLFSNIPIDVCPSS